MMMIREAITTPPITVPTVVLDFDIAVSLEDGRKLETDCTAPIGNDYCSRAAGIVIVASAPLPGCNIRDTRGSTAKMTAKFTCEVALV